MTEEKLLITKIEMQKKNNKRVSIYIDDAYAFGLSLDVALKFNLEEGKRVEKSFIEKALKKEEQNKANNYAIRLLSYRSRSRREIEVKMKEKGYDERIIDDTITYLEKYGLINDEEFAKEFIKAKSKKFGRRRIEIELSQKGVADQIIDDVFDKKISDEHEYDVALILARKKMKSYIGDDRNAIYRKMGSFLQRKGFDYSIISKVLKEIVDYEL